MTGPKHQAATPIVVQKYGGSSVTDLDGIRAVARRVVDTVAGGHRVVVEKSACAGSYYLDEDYAKAGAELGGLDGAEACFDVGPPTEHGWLEY